MAVQVLMVLPEAVFAADVQEDPVNTSSLFTATTIHFGTCNGRVRRGTISVFCPTVPELFLLRLDISYEGT